MITTTRRAVTDEEKQYLRMTMQGTTRASLPVLSIVGLCILGVCTLVYGLAVASAPSSSFAPWRYFIVAVALTVTLGLKVVRDFIKRINLARDIGEGGAEVIAVEATDAVKIVGRDHEGTRFVLEVGPGKVLFLTGDYLMQPESERRFPCTRFVITRAGMSRLVLDLRCEGEPLQPRFHPISTEKMPEDGALLHGSTKTPGSLFSGGSGF